VPNLAKALLALWLLLTGVAQGKSMHTAGPPPGNFFARPAEAIRENPPQARIRITIIVWTAWKCASDCTYCHNDPINRVDVLGAAEYERNQAQNLLVLRAAAELEPVSWAAYDHSRRQFANQLAWSGGPWARYVYLEHGEENFMQWDARMEYGADKMFGYVAPVLVTAGGVTQMGAGVMLLVTPEPTMATKVAGWYNVGAGADVLAGAWLTDDGKGFRQRTLEGIGMSSGWASGAILLTDIGVNAGAAVNWAGVSNPFKDVRFPRIRTVPGELYCGVPRLKCTFPSPRSLLDDIVADANMVASPGGAISDAQAQLLRQNLPVVQRRSAAQNAAMRADFVRDQRRLISQWEQATGTAWPQGATPHHIIPLESGGANKWWNLMPTNGALPNHSLPGIFGPHAAGGLLRGPIQQGRRSLPPGTTTDLRRLR
jgi:hypothetical protein